MKRWEVCFVNGRTEIFNAVRMTIESGVLVFWLVDSSLPEGVCLEYMAHAIGPTQWGTVLRVPEQMERP